MIFKLKFLMLNDTTNPDQSGFGINNNEGVFYAP